MRECLFQYACCSKQIGTNKNAPDSCAGGVLVCMSR